VSSLLIETLTGAWVVAEIRALSEDERKEVLLPIAWIENLYRVESAIAGRSVELIVLLVPEMLVLVAKRESLAS
jgi:hypothetical protein